MTFNDIKSLTEYLRDDQEKATINPIRFINVESMSVWIEVKKVVLSLCDRTVFLSDFCEGADTTPNIKRVLSKLKTYDKTTLVAPLSEYLRIKPDVASATISKILSTDYANNDDGKMRIYFLMYRMKDVLKNIPNNDPRKSNAFIYLDSALESDYSLTIIQDDLRVSLAGNEIFGFKKYLEYWEQNPDKPLILHTKNAIYFEESIFFDNVIVIVNAFDLLKFRYNLSSNFTYEMGDKDKWNYLARSVSSEGSFESACKSTLNSNKFSINILERWNSFDEYMCWLTWLWIKSENDKSYVGTCAIKSNSVKEFIDAITNGIFASINSSSYLKVYLERIQALKNLKLPTLPESFWESINGLPPLEALKCLTDITVKEKETLFAILSNIDYEEREPYLQVLRVVYPRLASYLGDGKENPADLPDEINDYLTEYKWLKATNRLTSSFYQKVQDYAKKQGEVVYQLETRRHLVDEAYDDESAIVFVDAMGAEYINYLSEQFATLPSSDYCVTFNAGYCHLPTVTEINKDFFDGRSLACPPIHSLDELKHSSTPYPQNINDELDVLDKIKSTILGGFNSTVRKIIIAADHGASRLAVLVRETGFDCKVKCEESKVRRHGRYCEGTQQKDELPTAICYDDLLIFGDYSRFEQKGAPSNEIHGGASIEEWVVPVITIEKTSGNEKQEKVDIDLLTPVVTPALATGEVVISFKMKYRKERQPFVKIHGKRINCNRSADTFTFTYLPEKNETDVKVDVYDKAVLGTFTVQIKQKISRNKNFDI